ncbi:MAG: proteasome accessory factor PafA2 family protein [Pirellula sp.]|nr:proteasome accessory factor PafA2 family protein [Pirellula sp.]
MGLETEYAIRGIQNSPSANRATFDFRTFAFQLEQKLPIANSFRNPYRVFLANGGCISLEHGFSTDLTNVLLESATPECRSPCELLTYQIAMEELLECTVRETFREHHAHLLKGSADAHGHTYGQHESYEMRIAKGWWLVGWRLGLLLMFPMVIAYRFAAAIWIAFIWLIGQASKQATEVLQRISMLSSNASKASLPNPSPNKPLWSLQPRWIGLCAAGLRVLHIPMAWFLWINIYCFALVPHRRHLTAFFASRCIIDGAGYLDHENRYWVSVRAAMVNSVIGYGSYGNQRPIFRCDSWLRALCVGSFWSIGSYCTLFRARQRVEIATGDSGLCQQSQYVRIGATALVLDLVEKSSPEVPRLKRVIEAIGVFSKDWMLVATVSKLRHAHRRNSVSDTKSPEVGAPSLEFTSQIKPGLQIKPVLKYSALDIQHSYAASVRHFLQSRSNIPIEAWKILDVWQTTLNQLHTIDDESHLQKNMLGRIDWLSKLWLMHQMKTEVNWQVRKKIDLRYHELSKDGYYRRLIEMLEIPPVIDAKEIVRAKRSPPQNSPATRRGYLIREFSDLESKLTVDWTRAVFHVEGEKQDVRF